MAGSVLLSGCGAARISQENPVRDITAAASPTVSSSAPASAGDGATPNIWAGLNLAENPAKSSTATVSCSSGDDHSPKVPTVTVMRGRHQLEVTFARMPAPKRGKAEYRVRIYDPSDPVRDLVVGVDAADGTADPAPVVADRGARALPANLTVKGSRRQISLTVAGEAITEFTDHNIGAWIAGVAYHGNGPKIGTSRIEQQGCQFPS